MNRSHLRLALHAIACAAAVAVGAHAAPRSQAARLAFVKLHACPATHKHALPCPGYIIDHRTPLDCGGADAPANMQWQTVAASKAKDKTERDGPGCAHRTHAPRS